jgi:glycosyltransferase involved in cell wall biosynthesis
VSHRRLSVVIPTWNRADLVVEAVESALRQEGGDLEVIVVDDGSSERTAEVIERRLGKSVKLLRIATREIGLLRDRLTAIERSIRPDRLTADLASALADLRWRISWELARLEAEPA